MPFESSPWLISSSWTGCVLWVNGEFFFQLATADFTLLTSLTEMRKASGTAMGTPVGRELVTADLPQGRGFFDRRVPCSSKFMVLLNAGVATRRSPQRRIKMNRPFIELR